MFARIRILPVLSLFALLLLLHGCADLELPGNTSGSTPLDQARNHENGGDFQRAADMYWLASQRAPAGQDVLLKIKASEMAYAAKNYNQVRAITSNINEKGLAKNELVRKRLVEARLARSRGDERQAMNLINISPAGLSPELQQSLVRFQKGEIEAAQTLSANDRSRIHGLMIQHQRSRDNNDAGLIWHELNQIDTAGVRGWLANSKDPLIRGWLDLSYQAKTNPEAAQWQRANAAWQQRYRGHPAFPGDPNSFIVRGGVIDAKVIAVMLPRSGPLARAGQVILNGISAAGRNLDGKPAPEIRVYDSAENPQNIYGLYATAVQQGADLVIGPFDKLAVDNLARQRLTVPVLALNHAVTEQLFNPNLFQFGLIPEDEAIAVAENMYQDGYTNVIAFAPESAWGKRLATTFEEKFTELGGTVLESGFYDGRANDYSDTIVRVLQVEKGEERHTGYRREDVEAIFVAANSRQARLFKPLLEFHFAEDLEVYTTSSSYSGIPSSNEDRDLNSINYLEMPWFLGLDPDDQDAVPAPEELIGDDRFYPRLFAFGVDAYRLAPLVRQLLVSPEATYNGYTGQVSAGVQNKLNHQLLRATFERGETKLLPLDTKTRDENYEIVQEKLKERFERLELEAEEKLKEAEEKARQADAAANGH